MQAAAPALVAVGFLMMTQVKHIDWDKYEIAIPAFLTIAVMPFTYSITNGIGAGFLAYVVIKTVLGKAQEVHWLLWGDLGAVPRVLRDRPDRAAARRQVAAAPGPPPARRPEELLRRLCRRGCIGVPLDGRGDGGDPGRVPAVTRLKLPRENGRVQVESAATCDSSRGPRLLPLPEFNV